MNNTNPAITVNSTIVTKAQLQSIGIDMPDDQMDALIQHAEDTINDRIGEEIVDSLNDQELAELVALQDSDAPAEQLEAWIVAHVSDYQEIIEDNVAIVLGELAESTDAIQA